MKMNAKGNDAFRTPPALYKQLDERFQFTIDAACSRDNCLAPRGFLYPVHDGLKESWKSERVFCNPPFSGKAKWIEKAFFEVMGGGCPIAVMVLPSNSMDSTPWHKFIYGNFYYHILHGRVAFIDPTTGKPRKGNNSGTTIVYFMKPPSMKGA